MPYRQDTEIEIFKDPLTKYIISSQHRKKGNPNKSIWTIKFEEELNCFVQSIEKKWNDGLEAWGIKLEGKALQVVGISTSNDELKLAKFVDGANTNVWHGYPADHMYKAQDRPATSILQSWVLEGYLSKSEMNKIRQGKLCNL